MSKKVLILDDDSNFRELIVSLLTEKGYTTVESEKTSDAYSIVSNNNDFSLLIIDGLLPDGTGIDFIQKIRKKGINNKIIFVSTFWKDLKTFKKLTNDYNVSLVLNKPVKPHEFIIQVDAIFQDIENETKNAVGAIRLKESKELLHSEAGSTTNKSEKLTVGNLKNQKKMSPELFEKLKKFKFAYKNKLTTGLNNILNLLDNEFNKTDDKEAINTLYMQVHKLHGTAGTYGYEDVSFKLKDAESILFEIISDKSDINPDTIWQIKQIIKSILKDLKDSGDKGSDQKSDNKQKDDHHTSTFLLVDDDEDFITAFKNIGTQNLVNIISATSREDALKIAKNNVLNGVFIDIILGENVDAFKLAREIRTINSDYHLPIAFISAADIFENRIKAAHAGGMFFLSKPINEQEIVPVFQEFSLLNKNLQQKILIVDDDEDFLFYTKKLLELNNYNVFCLKEADQILATMDKIKPDLVLLDIIMPKISGFDICRLLRTSTDWRDVPILFLTGKISKDIRLACYKAGADDYITKPVEREELLARITVRLERSYLLNELNSKDHLTTLLNRKTFLSALNKQIAKAERNQTPISLCFVDIDHFKNVNDTYGHHIGDNVLHTFGKLTAARFRSYDLCARWGGEEFVIAFSGESGDVSKAVMKRFLEEFKKQKFYDDKEKEFTVSFSAGIAVYPENGTDINTLLKTADKKLYQAKSEGRSKVIY